jgi:hypothetical protein
MLPGNDSQHHVVYNRNRNVSFSSISRNYVSLQAPCQIFVNWSAWLESLISRSLASDVQIHCIYLMCYVALMLLIFITFCVLNSIVSYDRSKHVIQVGAFGRRWFFCGRENFSFNRDRRSTSCFKIFSRSQKVNNLVLGLKIPVEIELDVLGALSRQGFWIVIQFVNMALCNDKRERLWRREAVWSIFSSPKFRSRREASVSIAKRLSLSPISILAVSLNVWIQGNFIVWKSGFSLLGFDHWELSELSQTSQFFKRAACLTFEWPWGLRIASHVDIKKPILDGPGWKLKEP